MHFGSALGEAFHAIHWRHGNSLRFVRLCCGSFCTDALLYGLDIKLDTWEDEMNLLDTKQRRVAEGDFEASTSYVGTNNEAERSAAGWIF